MAHLFSLNQLHSIPFTLSYQKFLPSSPLTHTFPNQANLQAIWQQEQLKAALQYQKTCSLQLNLQKLQVFKQLQNSKPLHCLNSSTPHNSVSNLPLITQQLSSSPLNLKEGNYENEVGHLQKDICSKEEIINHTQILPLKAHIRNMVYFFLHEFGLASKKTIENQRSNYEFNAQLRILFDTLNDRFTNTGKCREDMIRFVLRKALSSMRNSLKDEHKLTSKAASLLLCRKYFGEKSEEMLRQNINLDDEEEILNFLLPYKSKSRHRTANNSFITEIFASEAFYQDYINYLRKFDEIIKVDNGKKAEKFIDYLLVCVQEGSIEKIKKYKRLPWLNTWIKSMKIIAHELLTINQWKSFNKKPRLDKNK